MFFPKCVCGVFRHGPAENRDMKRSSLFRIILYIVCAITVLLVILVACLFSVVGHEMYAGMKIDELKPKAQSISQRVTKLYESNTDSCEDAASRRIFRIGCNNLHNRT